MTETQDENIESMNFHPYGDPVISYFLAFCISSVMFVASMSELQRFGIGVAVVAWFLGGFIPAQVLMTVPWAIALRIFRRTKLLGWIYFPVTGAVSIVLLSCVASCFAPRLLNVEDQTFLETMTITMERQGVSLLLAGLTFGLAYWVLAIRFPKFL